MGPHRPRGPDRTSRLITLLAVSFLASAPSCGLIPDCPETVEEAIGGDFGFVAVGRVARFVASPDPDFRGYDLDIRHTFSGSASTEGTFLRMSDEVPQVERAQAVLIIAESGPNPRTLIAGDCVPLRAISDDEFVRWTGSP